MIGKQMPKLTPKQEGFVELYLEANDAAAAAREVGS